MVEVIIFLLIVIPGGIFFFYRLHKWVQRKGYTQQRPIIEAFGKLEFPKCTPCAINVSSEEWRQIITLHGPRWPKYQNRWLHWFSMGSFGPTETIAAVIMPIGQSVNLKHYGPLTSSDALIMTISVTRNNQLQSDDIWLNTYVYDFKSNNIIFKAFV